MIETYYLNKETLPTIPVLDVSEVDYLELKWIL